MSMYNMVCKTNALAPFIARILSDAGISLERERDYSPQERNGELVLAAYTPCGGGNREEYAAMWETVRKHPLYIADADDSFDSTYAYAFFRVPESIAPSLRALCDALPIVLVTPTEKTAALLATLEGRKPEPPEVAKRKLPSSIDEPEVDRCFKAFYTAVTGEVPSEADQEAR
jgi:hypothetical protein